MKHLPFIVMTLVSFAAIEGLMGLDPRDELSTGIFVMWILTFVYTIQEIGNNHFKRL